MNPGVTATYGLIASILPILVFVVINRVKPANA
jgi:hypothetical protein